MLSVQINNTEILLREVADIVPGNSPREILHNNQNRIVEITADLESGLALDQVASSIDRKLEEVELDGYADVLPRTLRVLLDSGSYTGHV